MKCPLFESRLAAQNNRTVRVYQDCLKEECAWWNGHNNECCFISTGKVLNAISTYLYEINHKMPERRE